MQDGRQVRNLENLICASPELKGQLTRNLVGSTGAACRSKIVKIIPIETQDGRRLWNLFCASSPEPPIDSKLGRMYGNNLLVKNSENHSDQKSKSAAILKIDFAIFSWTSNRPTPENASYETFVIRAFSLLSLDGNW